MFGAVNRRIEAVDTNVKEFGAGMKKHPILALLLSTFIIGCQFVVGKGYEKIYSSYVEDQGPDIIIKKQEEHFSKLNGAIASLSGRVSAGDAARLAELKSAMEDAKNTGSLMAAKLHQLDEDNKTIRRTLMETKGLDGGVDFLILAGNAFKIDKSASIGYYNPYVSSSTSHADFSFSSLGQDGGNIRKRLNAGEAITFKNEAGKRCQVTYLGVTNPQSRDLMVGKFAYQCGNQEVRRPT